MSTHGAECHDVRLQRLNCEHVLSQHAPCSCKKMMFVYALYLTHTTHIARRGEKTRYTVYTPKHGRWCMRAC
eukprot:scaffold8676_cov51-Phaeocystis_antarctica.AAC.1